MHHATRFRAQLCRRIRSTLASAPTSPCRDVLARALRSSLYTSGLVVATTKEQVEPDRHGPRLPPFLVPRNRPVLTGAWSDKVAQTKGHRTCCIVRLMQKCLSLLCATALWCAPTSIVALTGHPVDDLGRNHSWLSLNKLTWCQTPKQTCEAYQPCLRTFGQQKTNSRHVRKHAHHLA